MGQAFCPESLQIRGFLCFCHSRSPAYPQRPGPLPVCQGHTGCGKSRAREVWQPRFFVDLGKVLKKFVCKASWASVFLGRGGWEGRLWLFWAAQVVGGAAGRSAAAPPVEKTAFRAFWRLRVGKSSTRMANRCPRIFDAGGKGRDQVGCWRSLRR